MPVADELQKSEIDIILASDDGDVVDLDAGVRGRVTLTYAECRLLAPSGHRIALAEWEDGWLQGPGINCSTTEPGQPLP